MKIKPAKSCSLSIQEGARSDNLSFSVDDEEIPSLADQPVWSLGRLYTVDLSDKHMADSVTSQLSNGPKINQSSPPQQIHSLVLPAHPVPAIDVAPQTVWHLCKASLEDGCKNQQLHLQVARPSSISFQLTLEETPWNFHWKPLSWATNRKTVRLVLQLKDSKNLSVQKAGSGQDHNLSETPGDGGITATRHGRLDGEHLQEGEERTGNLWSCKDIRGKVVHWQIGLILAQKLFSKALKMFHVH